MLALGFGFAVAPAPAHYLPADGLRVDGGCVMDESDFEGTLVLERLAEIGRVDDFFDAIDADDVQRATSLMKRAKIDLSAIASVIKKMEDGDG